MTKTFGLGTMVLLWALWFAMPSYFVLHDSPFEWFVIMFIGIVAFGPAVYTLAHIAKRSR